jgi:peptidoglycan hydrolase-like protein with peptidoglycan-binding domain
VAAAAAASLAFDMKINTISKLAALVLSIVAIQSSFAAGQEEPDPAVRAVQATLAARGLYNGPINGVPDQTTRVAVARYQGNHKLPPTGKLTQRTLRSLGVLIDSQT